MKLSHRCRGERPRVQSLNEENETKEMNLCRVERKN